MPGSLARDGREHMVRWYCERARPWLADKVADFAARMEVAPAGVRVQDLGYRWGSCGKGDLLYFHWKSILLPAPIAEYIVVHELAHLHEPHHTPEFWRRVERVLPQYERCKDWLKTRGRSRRTLTCQMDDAAYRCKSLATSLETRQSPSLALGRF